MFYVLESSLGFPIGSDSSMLFGCEDMFSETERLVYSIMYYVIWLSTLLTIPFFFGECFKNQQFYENFIIAWLIVSVSESMLYHALFCGGWVPDGGSFVKHIIFILVLTLLPAIYQHQKS
ncbi:hypothetical protein [Methyloglobulus sp.]|uniref:hypothetical protein n=1 Tax=Methyloglobulus sp. TaxID=2518622 RepID=UPI0032B7D7B1